MNWTDTTGYARGQQGKKEPTEWTLKSGDLSISVHRYLGLPGWFVSCYQLNIDRKKLQSEDLKHAQVEALTILLDTVRKMEHEIKTMIASQIR